MIFNFSITKHLKQVVLLTLTNSCFFTLQSFNVEKEDVKIKESTLTWVGSKLPVPTRELLTLNLDT